MDEDKKKEIGRKKTHNEHPKEADYLILARKLEDSMSALTRANSLKGLGESMKVLQFVDPLRDLKFSIKALQIADPFKGLRESMKALQFADPFKDLRVSMRTLQMADPLKELRESMKASQVVDPLKDLRVSMRTLQMTDPLRGLRESMKALQFADPFKDLRVSIKTFQMADPLKELRKSLKTLRYSLQLDEIRAQFNDLNRSFNVYGSIFQNSIPATNLEEAYQEVVSRVIIARSDNDIDEALSVVADEIEQDSKIAQKSFLSIEFYITLIISFVFLLYSMQLSKESENRLTEHIINIQTAVMERLEEVLSTEQTDVHYVVVKPVNLRLKPTTKKNNVINILYSNQTTRLIERKGKWIKVEYFNHISGVHEHGWCYKKYLKRLKTHP